MYQVPYNPMVSPTERGNVRTWLQTTTGQSEVAKLFELLRDGPWELKDLGMQSFWVSYKRYLSASLGRKNSPGELKRLLYEIPGVEVKGSRCGLAGKDIYYWQRRSIPQSTNDTPQMSIEANQWLASSEGQEAVLSLTEDLKNSPMFLPSVGNHPFWERYKEHLSRDLNRARHPGEMRTVLALIPTISIRGERCGLSNEGDEYWGRKEDSVEFGQVFDSEDQANYVGIAHIKPSSDFPDGAIVTLSNCQNRVGDATADMRFIQEMNTLGFSDGNLAIARKTMNGEFLYKDKQLPIQVLRWDELDEGRKGISVLDFFAEKKVGDEIAIRDRSLLNRIIIEDGAIAITGFSFNPKKKSLVVDILRMTDNWPSVVQELRGICWSQYIGKGIRVFIPKTSETPTETVLGEEYFDKKLSSRQESAAPTIGDIVDFSGLQESVDGIPEEEPIDNESAPMAEPVDIPIPNVDSSSGRIVIWEESEKNFLEDFFRYVNVCNFKYARRDLIRLHTSIKCGMLTVLGGEPGTGKSSLARLYANVLTGKGKCDFLRVDVSPAWTEPEDLIGYRDYNGTFVPAANGLYGFLDERKDDASIVIVCLEEMNLARVEYYFNQFLQSVDRTDRVLRIVDGKDLILPPELHFIGTINFDETVQELSPRVYDRCNYLELQNIEKDVFSTEYAQVQDYEGNMIDRDTYVGWMKIPEGRKIGEQTKEMYNQLKELLKPLHLVPSPRVATAMMHYVMVRPAMDGETEMELQQKAFDEAIVQRVLPKCRRADSSHEKEQMALYDAFDSMGLTLAKEYYGRMIGW